MVDWNLLPSNFHIISRCDQSRKIVREVLCDKLQPCMPVVFKMTGFQQRDVTLIGLEYNSRFLIFDLRTCPKLVLEGHLYRVFISPDIVKVIHGTGHEVLRLSSKHNIIMRNLFDTQKAFDWVTSYNDLPNRQIGVACLHAKLNIFTDKLDVENISLSDVLAIPSFVDNTGFDWSKRPLTREMLLQVIAEVEALKKCYQGLCSIGPHFADVFELMRNQPDDVIRHLSPTADPERKKLLCNGIRKGLIDIGQSVLTDTLPLAEVRNTPQYRLDV